MRIARLFACAMLVLIARTEVFAQQRVLALPKAQLEVDGIYRATSQTLTDSATPVINAENGSLTATYDIPAGAAFSASGAYRFWKNLGVGASVTHFTAGVSTHVNASLPHPFLFGRARTIDSDGAEVTRDETAIAIHARAFLPLTPRLTLSVFGGPAITSVSQEMITDINYTEAYPYDTATLQGEDHTKDSVTKVGLSLGADVAYFFTRQIGAGFGARYAGGHVNLKSMGSDTLESSIGGFDLAFGLRLRF